MSREQVRSSLAAEPTGSAGDFFGGERYDYWLFGGHESETGLPVEAYVVRYDRHWKVKSFSAPRIQEPHPKVKMKTITLE